MPLLLEICELAKKKDKEGIKKFLNEHEKSIDFVTTYKFPDKQYFITHSTLLAYEGEMDAIEFLVREFDIDPGWVRIGLHKAKQPVENDYVYPFFQNQVARSSLDPFRGAARVGEPFPGNLEVTDDRQDALAYLAQIKDPEDRKRAGNIMLRNYAMIDDGVAVNELLRIGYNVENAIEGYASGGHFGKVNEFFKGTNPEKHKHKHVVAAIIGYTKGGHYQIVGEIERNYQHKRLSHHIRECFAYYSPLSTYHYKVMQIFHHFSDPYLKRDLVDTHMGGILMQKYYNDLTPQQQRNFDTRGYSDQSPLTLYVEKFVTDSENIARLMREKNVSFNVAYAALCPAMQHVDVNTNLDNFAVEKRGSLNTDPNNEAPILVSKKTAEAAFKLYSNETYEIKDARVQRLKGVCQTYINHLINDRLNNPSDALDAKMEKMLAVMKDLNRYQTPDPELLQFLNEQFNDASFRTALEKHRPKNAVTMAFHGIFKYKTDGQKVLHEVDALLDTSTYNQFNQPKMD